jgi:pyruvate carboxylase subunit B
MKPDVIEVEPGVYSVLLGEKSYEIRLEGDTAECRGVTVELPEAAGGRHTKRAAGASNISSNMPGKVVRLLVADGDAVEAGQEVIVVEAMKMQNEMKAPKAGVVRGLKAKPGDTVAAKKVIARIE